MFDVTVGTIQRWQKDSEPDPIPVLSIGRGKGIKSEYDPRAVFLWGIRKYGTGVVLAFYPLPPSDQQDGDRVRLIVFLPPLDSANGHVKHGRHLILIEWSHCKIKPLASVTNRGNSGNREMFECLCGY